MRQASLSNVYVSSKENQAVHQPTVLGFNTVLADSIPRLAHQELVPLNSIKRVCATFASDPSLRVAEDQGSAESSTPCLITTSVGKLVISG